VLDGLLQLVVAGLDGQGEQLQLGRLPLPPPPPLRLLVVLGLAPPRRLPGALLLLAFARSRLEHLEENSGPGLLAPSAALLLARPLEGRRVRVRAGLGPRLSRCRRSPVRGPVGDEYLLAALDPARGPEVHLAR